MDRIVDIATDGQHLSIHRGFLIVEREREEIGRVALDDIHAVIVHARGATCSQSGRRPWRTRRANRVLRLEPFADRGDAAA
uniref:hypothetical protein n=1 Tax=Altererythrobacter segetis TaxID=1104773 RepID=UPI001FAED05F|nr:hypothetical protein [Altererythrobacter segetis]